MCKLMKVIPFGLMAALLLALAGCGPQPDASDSGEVDEKTGVISDVSSGDVETHEEIIPQVFEEGERVENLYYKRTVNPADGEPAYLVTKASSGSDKYLPMANTVIYTIDNGPCYYEQVTLSYLLDGVPTEQVQYQLHATASVPPETGGSNGEGTETDTVENDDDEAAKGKADAADGGEADSEDGGGVTAASVQSSSTDQSVLADSAG